MDKIFNYLGESESKILCVFTHTKIVVAFTKTWCDVLILVHELVRYIWEQYTKFKYKLVHKMDYLKYYFITFTTHLQLYTT